MKSTSMQKQIVIIAILAFLMLLTRGSHVMTHMALPDASLALLFIGGLLLRKAVWFGLLVILATVIDFSVAAVDSFQAFCITDGYWGMFPTYAVMWLAGVWLAKQDSVKLDMLKFVMSGIAATFAAFVISTQTYYLFSGRFPDEGLFVSIQHGWEYLPSYMGYTMMYLLAFWGLAKALPMLGLQHTRTA